MKKGAKIAIIVPISILAAAGASFGIFYAVNSGRTVNKEQWKAAFCNVFDVSSRNAYIRVEVDKVEYSILCKNSDERMSNLNDSSKYYSRMSNGKPQRYISSSSGWQDYEYLYSFDPEYGRLGYIKGIEDSYSKFFFVPYMSEYHRKINNRFVKVRFHKTKDLKYIAFKDDAKKDVSIDINTTNEVPVLPE